ncbi:MAG TPA: fructose-6-phosphate aldolase [Anaerolineae bacterium]|jgi:transaldolase|nr:fructose-6-phosphate aldolase [Anaerolineae bacterium]
MKLFIDTANIEHIKEMYSLGIISGVTTNPTLCSKEGMDFKTSIAEIASIVDGPISAEAVSLTRDGIVQEGRELATIAPNVVVKVPMMEEGIAATKVLSSEGIKVNMTLIFSANQALLAAQVGAAYVSPFIGRLDDIGHDGVEILDSIGSIYDIYGIDTKIISASIRHPLHVTQSALAGADIATVPYSVLKAMIKHPLTDIGIQKFLEDWKVLQETASSIK